MVAQFEPYQFMQRLRDNRGLPSRAKLVALILVSYAKSGDNIVYPSVDTIAAASGLSADTVMYALRDLDKAGVVKPLKQRRGGGSKARALFYPRHNASAPVPTRTRTVTENLGSTNLRDLGSAKHEVTKKINPDHCTGGERSGALAPTARAATHRHEEALPVNNEAIYDFWGYGSIPWAEWIAEERTPSGRKITVDRPTGASLDAANVRVSWDTLRAEWEEEEGKVAQKLAADVAACPYGCDENATFVHTDGTLWYCAHNEPWADQVQHFRDNYEECRQ